MLSWRRPACPKWSPPTVRVPTLQCRAVRVPSSAVQGCAAACGITGIVTLSLAWGPHGAHDPHTLTTHPLLLFFSPSAAETALDDATFDAHGSGGLAAAGPPDNDDASKPATAAATESAAGSERQQVGEEAEEGQRTQHAQDQPPQQQETQQKQKQTRFDRLVSSVFALEGSGASKLSGSSSIATRTPGGHASMRRGPGVSFRRLTSGYLRRAVSARFGGDGDKEQVEGGEEEEEAEQGRSANAPPPRGKSGWWASGRAHACLIHCHCDSAPMMRLAPLCPRH